LGKVSNILAEVQGQSTQALRSSIIPIWILMAMYEQPRVPSAPRYTAIVNVCQDHLKAFRSSVYTAVLSGTRPLIKMVYMGGERWGGFIVGYKQIACKSGVIGQRKG
jgi:hypothetical protein